MSIYILLVIGLFFLIFTGVLIAIDNRKRKYKHKMLPFNWKIIGIITTFLAIISISIFFKEFNFFHGTECSNRKIILRSTMNLSDVYMQTEDAKLDNLLEKNLKEIINNDVLGNKNIKIKYVDALLNKKVISFADIHEIKYSDDLSRKQIQVVEYLVNTKDGFFTKPGIYYYIIFSSSLKEGKTEKVKTEKTSK